MKGVRTTFQTGLSLTKVEAGMLRAIADRNYRSVSAQVRYWIAQEQLHESQGRRSDDTGNFDAGRGRIGHRGK